MIPNQRHLFDIPDSLAYLNFASHSPFLKAAIAAGQRGIRRKAHPWRMDRPAIAAEVEKVRAGFAGLIGARPADVAIVPAASYGIATAAANLPIAAGQKVVVLEDEFPSNRHAWRERCAAEGARLAVVPRPADADWTAALLEAIGMETAVVAAVPCYWTDGNQVDLEAVGARCRAVGAALVVDATQAVGASPLDVGRIKPDFLVCSGYKWLLCPYTLSFLYAAPRRQNGQPLEHHALNRIEPEIWEGSLRYPAALAPDARRYDMGERANMITMPMAAEALNQLGRWTVPAIAETLRSLVDEIAVRATERGFSVLPADRRIGHFIGLRPDGALPERVDERLAEQGVYVSVRNGLIRVAPHLHVSVEDVDRLFEALDAVCV